MVLLARRGLRGLAGSSSGGPVGFGTPISRVRFPNQATQVAYLRGVVDYHRGWPDFRRIATHIVFDWARCPMRDKRCHALAVGRWVQQHITYVNEGEETFATPAATLQEGFGDCDEFTVLIGTLLESIGVDVQVVGLEWDDQYRHIYPRALVGAGPPLPLDATLSTPVGQAEPILMLARRGKTVRALAL